MPWGRDSVVIFCNVFSFFHILSNMFGGWSNQSFRQQENIIGRIFFFYYSTGNTSEVLQVCHLHSVRLFKIIGHLRGGTASALNTDIQWVKPISPGFWSASVWQSASTDRQWLALIFNLKVLFQALAGGWLPLPCSDIHLSDLNGKTRAPSGPAWRAVWILGVPHWIQPHANAKPFSRLNKDKANDSFANLHFYHRLRQPRRCVVTRRFSEIPQKLN